MKSDISVTLYLDTRRSLSDGKFPLKLRVYSTTLRKVRMFNLKFNFYNEEFEKITRSERPRGDLREQKDMLDKLVAKAKEIGDDIRPFSFKQFEQKLFQPKTNEQLVKVHFERKMHELFSNGQISTYEGYGSSMNSLKKFSELNAGISDFNHLVFAQIDVDFLNQYEAFAADKGLSPATIGIYLRNLRTLMNKVVSDGVITLEQVPFGRNKYVIPSRKKKKVVLTTKEMATLFSGEPQSEYQEKAKDFWFLSFTLNGVNIKDIALLKWGQINGEKAMFVREKTKRSTKASQVEIEVFINEFARTVIEKYGSDDRSEDSLVFDIVKSNMSPTEIRREVKNFNKYVNQHFSNYARCLGIEKSVSPVQARHSFATQTITRGGKSMEFAMESLGHQNLSTTKNYFAGFEDEQRREFASKLLDFGA